MQLLLWFCNCSMLIKTGAKKLEQRKAPLSLKLLVHYSFFFFFSSGQWKLTPTVPYDENLPLIENLIEEAGAAEFCLHLIKEPQSGFYTRRMPIHHSRPTSDGGSSRGGKWQCLEGRERKKKKGKIHVKLSCRLLSWDANTPEAAELDPDPVDDEHVP